MSVMLRGKYVTAIGPMKTNKPHRYKGDWLYDIPC